jgi:hypothetical protein
MKNKYLPTLVTGFVAAVLVSIPLVKHVGCCVIVPVAAFYALILDVKLNKAELPIKGIEAFVFGILTGLWAAVFSVFFETIITLFTHTNDFIKELPEIENYVKNQSMLTLKQIFEVELPIYKSMANDIKTTGFSLFYTFSIFFINIFIDVIFGIIGGFIGMNYLNKRKKPPQ